jgi:WhiB family transcriptional regulator, redox-sensing transcriptional regulator
MRSGEIDLEERDRMFFPTRHYVSKDIADAKAICRGCFVRPECLEYALETGIEEGIWGGTTERERRLLRRKRKAVDRAAGIPEMRRPPTVSIRGRRIPNERTG